MTSRKQRSIAADCTYLLENLGFKVTNRLNKDRIASREDRILSLLPQPRIRLRRYPS